MDREHAKQLLNDYLDDELDAGTREELEAVLRADEELRAELEALRRTVSTLSRLRGTAPPAEFARKVERKIHRRSRGRFFGRGTQSLLKLPFEWFSFVIIILLLTLYMLYTIEARRLQPKPKAGSGGKPPAGEQAPKDGARR